MFALFFFFFFFLIDIIFPVSKIKFGSSYRESVWKKIYQHYTVLNKQVE